MEVFIPDYLAPKEFQGKYPYGSNLEDGDNGYMVPISVWGQVFSKTVILNCSVTPSASRVIEFVVIT